MKNNEVHLLENVERWKSEAFHNNKTTAILVENLYDRKFWTAVFRAYAPNISLDFPYTSAKDTNGKDDILKYADFVAKNFVICRDADSQQFYPNKYSPHFAKTHLYHTFTYDKDGHLCYHTIINDILQDITQQQYDTAPFLQKYSEITYSLWIYWITAHKLNLKLGNYSLSMEHLSSILSLKNEIEQSNTIKDIDCILDDFSLKIKKHITTISKRF
jgi:hypothetical protein